LDTLARPKAPYLFVGNKIDLRVDTDDDNFVQTEFVTHSHSLLTRIILSRQGAFFKNKDLTIWNAAL